MTPEFRAFDTKEKKYWYDNFAIHPDGVIFILDGGNREIIGARLSSEFIIEQFTGKLDRNGEKVFAGDKMSDDKGEYIGVVVFGDLPLNKSGDCVCTYPAFYVHCCVGSTYSYDSMEISDWMEITGTIHD